MFLTQWEGIPYNKWDYTIADFWRLYIARNSNEGFL